MTTISTIKTTISTIAKATFGFGLLGLVAFSGLNSTVNVHAGGLMGGDYLRVNTNTLNVRDKDCKKITTIKKDSMVILDVSENPVDPNPILKECKIGNKTYPMVQVNFGINDTIDGFKYVATEYLTFVGRNNFSSQEDIIAKEDVNLRDKNCKRIKILKKGTKAMVPSAGAEMINCKINGTSYGLISINVDGVDGYSATEFWTQGN
jgi:hypothetical protein